MAGRLLAAAAAVVLETLPMEEFRPTAVLLFVPLPRAKKLLIFCFYVVCVAFRELPENLAPCTGCLLFELCY